MQMFCKLDEGTGSMPVRWCLDEDEQTKIVNQNLNQLLVVIDILYEGSCSVKDRFIVPLGNEMQYVSFRRPGIAHVSMALITPKNTHDTPPLKKIKAYLNSKSSGRFEVKLFQIPRNNVELAYDVEWNPLYKVIATTSQKIDVPADYFAEPLPKWIEWWVTLVPRELLRQKLVDECHMRRWAIFSIFVQLPLIPVAAAVGIAMLAIASILYISMVVSRGLSAAYLEFILGYRRINWKATISMKPSVDFGDVWLSSKIHNWSSFYEKNEKDDYLPLWREFAQPSFIIPVITVIYMLQGISSENISMTLWAFLFFLLSIPGIIILVIRWTTRVSLVLTDKKKPIKVRKATKVNNKEQEIFKQEIAEMSCPLKAANLSEMTKVSALPAKKRTLKLRAAAFKSKVCKPFAV